MRSGDIEAVVELYTREAAVVSFRATARGHEQIRALTTRSLVEHGHYDVKSIDQILVADDVVCWESTVDTDDGLLLTSHVAILDGEGRITHHVPGIRGYWGM